MKITRVTKDEFELENGDIYPIPFEIDEEISVEEFQKCFAASQDMFNKLMEEVEKINEESADNKGNK